MTLPKQFAFACLLAALVASFPCAADEANPNDHLVEFFKNRDAWLWSVAFEEFPTVKEPVLPELNDDRIRIEKAEVEKRETELATIQKRIKSNSSKPSLAALVRKDKLREEEAAKRLEKAAAELAKQEERRLELLAKRESMLSQYREETRDRNKRASAYARDKAIERRQRLDFFPPNTPLFDVPNLEVGMFGVLPQWPVGNFDPIEKRIFESALSRLETGTGFGTEERALAPVGGVAVAKKRANIRVVQVLDKERLLVQVIGKFDWPIFLLRIEDTSNLVNDSLMREPALLLVEGRYKYTAVNNSERVVFVVRRAASADLPKFSFAGTAKQEDEKKQVPPQGEGEQSQAVEPMASAELHSAPEAPSEDARIIAALRRKVSDLQRDVKRLTKEARAADAEVKRIQASITRLERIKSPSIVEEREATDAKFALREARERAKSVGSELAAKQIQLESVREQLD